MSNLFAQQQGPLPLPATLETTELLKEALDAEVIALRGKIDQTKRLAAADGVYADPVWFGKAQAKLRYLNRDQQRVNEHLGRLRKIARQDRHRATQERLLLELRKVVGEATFQACVAQAEAAEA